MSGYRRGFFYHRRREDGPSARTEGPMNSVRSSLPLGINTVDRQSYANTRDSQNSRPAHELFAYAFYVNCSIENTSK